MVWRAPRPRDRRAAAAGTTFAKCRGAGSRARGFEDNGHPERGKDMGAVERIVGRARKLTAIAGAIVIVGCAATGCNRAGLRTPLNAAESLNDYGYHPIDPLPVELKGAASPSRADVLNALPDETMRLAI